MKLGRYFLSSMWLFSRIKGPKGGFSTTERTDSKCFLGGGFKNICFIFTPINIFQLGWNHHLVFFWVQIMKVGFVWTKCFWSKEDSMTFGRGKRNISGKLSDCLLQRLWYDGKNPYLKQKPLLERWSLVNQPIKKWTTNNGQGLAGYGLKKSCQKRMRGSVVLYWIGTRYCSITNMLYDFIRIMILIFFSMYLDFSGHIMFIIINLFSKITINIYTENGFSI